MLLGSIWCVLAAISQGGQLELGPALQGSSPPAAGSPFEPVLTRDAAPAAEPTPAAGFPADTGRTAAAPGAATAAPAPATGFSEPTPAGQRFAPAAASEPAPRATGVVPVGGVVPLQSIPADVTGPAAAVLQQALSGPDRGGLEGQAVTLKQVIERSLGSPERLSAVQAYWRLSREVASYHFAVAEGAQVAQLPAPQGRQQQAQLGAAQAAAKARLSQARLAAIQAQHDLIAAGGAAAQSLPLPADAPFVGPYQTHFDALRARAPSRNPCVAGTARCRPCATSWRCRRPRSRHPRGRWRNSSGRTPAGRPS